MAFTKQDRQRIIDEYLAATGRNLFVPGEFIDWLAGNPEHEAYDWFYSKTDEEAAREWRIGLARGMAAGLRIEVKTEEVKASVTSITVREYPAYVSPVAGRKDGGGYIPFNPSDADAVAELRRQGAVALQSWLARYRGAFETAGISVSGIDAIAAQALAQVEAA